MDQEQYNYAATTVDQLLHQIRQRDIAQNINPDKMPYGYNTFVQLAGTMTGKMM